MWDRHASKREVFSFTDWLVGLPAFAILEALAAKRAVAALCELPRFVAPKGGDAFVMQPVLLDHLEHELPLAPQSFGLTIVVDPCAQ